MGRTRVPEAVEEPVETLAELLYRLGDIAPGRVLAKPPPGTATETDLMESIRTGPRKLLELVDGCLVEKAMGSAESILASPLHALLEFHVYENDLGVVLGEAGQLRLAPDNVRIADVAYISWKRLPRPVILGSIAAISPDLAVEVLSPGNTRREIDRKIRDYFDHGTRLVWVLQPKSQTADVYASPTDRKRIPRNGTLDGSPVLPGFTVPLLRVFTRLEPRTKTA
ncbi:MAG: Uma2 family endonuclease [Gemmataceae bacterium]|nr:Uma2 family endonuclease [Gemmataceae bacterium]